MLSQIYSAYFTPFVYLQIQTKSYRSGPASVKSCIQNIYHIKCGRSFVSTISKCPDFINVSWQYLFETFDRLSFVGFQGCQFSDRGPGSEVNSQNSLHRFLHISLNLFPGPLYGFWIENAQQFVRKWAWQMLFSLGHP